MSIERVESTILALPLEDRRQLTVWFDEHLAELLGDTPFEFTSRP